MKLYKKLTLSITTLACVLSLASCNDNKKEENGFKNIGNEVTQEEIIALYADASAAMYEHEGDFTNTIDGNCGSVLGDRGEKIYSNSLLVIEYDSDSKIYKESSDYEYTASLDKTVEKTVTYECQISDYVRYIDEIEKTYYDDFYATFNPKAEYDSYLENANFGTIISDEYYSGYKYYANNNVFTVTADDELVSGKIQIQFYDDLVVYLMDVEATFDGQTTSETVKFTISFKNVKLDPIDVTNYTRKD